MECNCVSVILIQSYVFANRQFSFSSRSSNSPPEYLAVLLPNAKIPPRAYQRSTLWLK